MRVANDTLSQKIQALQEVERRVAHLGGGEISGDWADRLTPPRALAARMGKKVAGPAGWPEWSDGRAGLCQGPMAADPPGWGGRAPRTDQFMGLEEWEKLRQGCIRLEEQVQNLHARVLTPSPREGAVPGAVGRRVE